MTDILTTTVVSNDIASIPQTARLAPPSGPLLRASDLRRVATPRGAPHQLVRDLQKAGV